MSYQRKIPTFEKFVLDPTNPTWLDDLNGWLDGLFPNVEVLEDNERGGAATGFYMIRVIQENDAYCNVMTWGDQPWVILHNNVDKSLTQITMADFNTYYEAV